MDKINTWTGLPMEQSIGMTEDRDKWRKYDHGRDAESSFFEGLRLRILKKLDDSESNSGHGLESRLRGFRLCTSAINWAQRNFVVVVNTVTTKPSCHHLANHH